MLSDIKMEKEVQEYAKKQLALAKEVVKKWELFLDISSIPKDKVEDPDTNTTVEKVERKKNKIDSASLRLHIARCIKEQDRLILARNIFDYLIKNANYTGSYTSFSSQLSLLLGKGIFKKHIVEDVPNDRKYWYGLVSFWDGDVLKAEYKDKLNEEVAINMDEFL